MITVSGYLAFCLAAASQNSDVPDNFIDSRFLANRRTRIREYLATRQPLRSGRRGG